LIKVECLFVFFVGLNEPNKPMVLKGLLDPLEGVYVNLRRDLAVLFVYDVKTLSALT
jgi:hypothetical protein